MNTPQGLILYKESLSKTEGFMNTPQGLILY